MGKTRREVGKYVQGVHNMMELILRRAVNIAQKTGLIRSNFVRKVGGK